LARKLYYKVLADGSNSIDDTAWEEIRRLQHWYNTEFVWTAGRLGLKMYAIFPNEGDEPATRKEIERAVARRLTEGKAQGLPENTVLERLQEEGLVTLKRGGYLDGCIASGFTRVAGNEFNAYLTCEFLLKASRIARQARFLVSDEGGFIKPQEIAIHAGDVVLTPSSPEVIERLRSMAENRHVFAIVDPAKYDRYPRYQPTVSDFNELPLDERQGIVGNWKWLGFESNFDLNGDDVQGFDLNGKVGEFRLEDLAKNA
jgi:hypothetical protein